jgi:hypothetical protein
LHDEVMKPFASETIATKKNREEKRMEGPQR